MFLNNRQSSKQLRKRLRNNATPQEVILWSRLRGSKLGYKFKRQSSIGSYIVDLYCPEKRLAIEIDGSQHIERKPDEERTKFLNTHGVRVLRFWDHEVNTNLDGVLQAIFSVLEEEETTTP